MRLMATFTAIPEKTQSATAMKRVIDYVMQDKKTLYNGIGSYSKKRTENQREASAKLGGKPLL